MLVNLRALFARVLDIVLLRAGPESLPASASLLAVLIAVNIAMTAIIVSLLPNGRDFSVLEILVSIAVPLLWYQVAFALANKRERFVQTMIAFFGVNIVFQPLLAPLIAALVPYIGKQDPALTPPAALSLLFIVVALWLLIVWVRVVRAAFEWPYVAVILFVFAQTYVAMLVDAMLFGVPSGKG